MARKPEPNNEFSRLSTIDHFTATVAHELRAPLATIMFNIDVLAKRHHKMNNDEFANILAEMSMAGARQSQSIDAILRAATCDSMESIVLEDIAEAVAEELRCIYGEKVEAVTLDIDSDHLIQGSKLLLRALFMNLLSNSVEAGSKPIAITLRSQIDIPAAPIRSGNSSVASAHGQRNRDLVRIFVCDTGQGIARELRDHIFEPHFSTKASGSGVGLALARQAARRMGGDIRLLADEDETCFEITLVRAARFSTTSGGEGESPWKHR